MLRLAPPLPFLPPEMHGKPIVAFAICYTGALEEGPSAVEDQPAPCSNVQATGLLHWLAMMSANAASANRTILDSLSVSRLLLTVISASCFIKTPGADIGS